MILQGPVGVNCEPTITNAEFNIKHNSGGHTAFFRQGAVVGTTVVIIPDGGDDVVTACYIWGIVNNSVPQTPGIFRQMANNSTFDVTSDSGTNNLRFTVAANGQLSVARTAGTATWDIAVWIIWF